MPVGVACYTRGPRHPDMQGEWAMNRIKRAVLGVTVAALAAPAVAGAVEPGTTYDDWTIACTEGEDRTCFARQVQKAKAEEGGKAGRLVDARVGYMGPEGKPAMVLWLPLGLNLQGGVGLKIDDYEVKRLTLTTCTQQGCRAQAVIGDKWFKRLRLSRELQVRFVPRGARQPAGINLSPDGLNKAVGALE